MSEIKYEAVFGPQELFIDAKKDTVVIVKYDDVVVFFSCYSDFFDHLRAVGRGLSVDAPVIAMRRIIAGPKRWTVADQKAGRLPEVGWYVYSENDSKSAVVIAKDHEGDIWFQCSCGIVRCTDGYAMLPIETPAEKAQREEDEFVNFVLHHGKSQINSSEELVAAKRAIKLTYELQLSGELASPKGGE